MKKLLVLLTILTSIASFSEDVIELGQTTVKGSKTSDYTAPPKEQKNTFVITQERIREKNYKNVEDILRDAPGVIVQNTAFGPRIDMNGVSINPTEETMASLPINAIPVESSELLPLVEVGASWEVCAFVSHIYLPSSSGNPYPDIFF